MKKLNLTSKQKELYLFIVEYVMKYHNFPAGRVCVEGTSYGAHSAVHNTITGRFVKEGLVETHDILDGKTVFSIVGLKMTAPEVYLEMKTPLFATTLREIMADEDKEGTPETS